MSATLEQIADANRIPFPPTERENLEAWRLYIDEAGRKNMAVRVPLEVLAALKKEAIPSFPTVPLTREEVDAAIAKGIPSSPTVRLAPQGLSRDRPKSSVQNKNKGQSFQQKQIEKEPKENNKTKKAQGINLETFLKINKDLVSTAGSRIERLFLHAASIAIFAIWWTAHELNLRKKIPVDLKTDGNRANRQNFRANTQTQAANIKVNQQPLPKLQQKGAGLLNRRLLTGRNR
jgi:hypothetical protein